MHCAGGAQRRAYKSTFPKRVPTLRSAVMSAVPKFRILARLTGDDTSARDALVRAAIAHTMAQPIASYVDRDTLVALAKAAATEANAALVISAHIRPGFERQKLRSARLAEKVGDLLPPDVDDRLAKLLDGLVLPEAAWARGLIDRKLVNQLIAPVLQQTLLAFAKKLPIPGLSGETGGAANAFGGALLGGLGGLAGGAGKLFDVGKSVVGGLGAEVEKKMQAVAKDFAENASDGLREALRQRLESDEGKKLLREIVMRAHTRLGEVEIEEILKDADALPAAELDSMVAAVIAHNATRKAVTAAVRAEIDAALVVDGAMTLGAFLDRAQVRAEVEAVVLARADVVTRAFFGSDQFSAWLDVLLAE